MDADWGQIFANSVGNVMAGVLVVTLILGVLSVGRMIKLIVGEMRGDPKNHPRP